MESERTGDPGREAERLEAALERIAQAATRRAGHAAVRGSGPQDESAPAEVGVRLDAIIAELRAALAGKPE
jgi:phage shock protein A